LKNSNANANAKVKIMEGKVEVHSLKHALELWDGD
jgi:hypothetical protein